MKEVAALNKKCPYSFSQEIGDFKYCILPLLVSRGIQKNRALDFASALRLRK